MANCVTVTGDLCQKTPSPASFQQMNKPELTLSAEPIRASIIVPTLRRPGDLDRCLAAVNLQVCDFPFDVIVVDNSSGDPDTRKVVTRWNARYIVEPNAGLCRARNRGALESNAEFVAYLDDDAVPEADWLSALVSEFDDPRVAVSTGKIIPLSVETDAEKLFHRFLGPAYARPGRMIVDKRTPQWFEICSFGGVGHGGNMAFRRSVFEAGFRFNERTGRGTPVNANDEHYAFMKMVDADHSIAYTPSAVVRHAWPATMRSWQEWQLENLSSSAAFLTMLAVEARGHRLATLKYILDALLGTRRKWRPSAGRVRVLSRRREVIALARGPLLYLLGRFSS